MHVVFVNRYFHPDHSATSQMLSDLAFHLARQGWAVEVIASRQRYDDARALLPRREVVGGVTVHRVATTRFGRALLAGRAVDYATFYVTSFFALVRRARRKSIVVALTDPPLISIVAALACAIRGAALVNWVQDLFPEVAEALGVIRGAAILRRLRDASLRRARTNVVLGETMRSTLERGRPARPREAGETPALQVQHNWADAALHPVAHEDNALRHEWRLGRRFVAGYSGNLGRAHDLATIADAMRAAPDVDFLIIGSGAQLGAVRGAARELDNVQFRPYQPRDALSESLSAADVHLISLRPELEGLIVPSKFYGILAVGRPVVFIGAKDGELGRIIEEHGCGFVVAPGDSEGLARVLRELAGDLARAAEIGRRNRALYEKRFAPHIALASWETILTNV